MITTQQTCLSGNTFKLFLFQCSKEWSTQWSGLALPARQLSYKARQKTWAYSGWVWFRQKDGRKFWRRQECAFISLAQVLDGEDTTLSVLLRAAFNEWFHGTKPSTWNPPAVMFWFTCRSDGCTTEAREWQNIVARIKSHIHTGLCSPVLELKIEQSFKKEDGKSGIQKEHGGIFTRLHDTSQCCSSYAWKV